MSKLAYLIGVFCAVLAAATPLWAAEAHEGTIVTFWPLFDYRSSPAEGFQNLSILGPLVKFENRGADRETAIRPFFFAADNPTLGTSSTDFLYPAASRERSPEADSYRVFGLFRKQSFRKQEGERKEEGTSLLPFYVSGTSERYGPYRAFIPFYGDIYQRFWRDEYHFVLFPLYGQTVNHGTTVDHYLFPFFSRTRGENESGFDIFPLYGQSEKSGVYRKRFVLWPFFVASDTGLDTDNPTRKRLFFPFYAETDAPKLTARSYLWPFFGYVDDRGRKIRETDWFWPFFATVKGEEVQSDIFLPFYSHEVSKTGEKSWFLWPLYKRDQLRSEEYRESYNRLLLLYSDREGFWPKEGTSRRRLAVWPLFLYKRSPVGVSSISFPAPVETLLDREGIDRNWAPFWRLYQRRWNDRGMSASSFLWNLFWHERRGEDLAYELFPLVFYRGEKGGSDLRLLKGLIGLKKSPDGEKELSLFWLPSGLKWGKGETLVRESR